MTRAHFQHAYSWPYNGRNFPLDHAYVRSLEVTKSEHYTCSSDHRGVILEVTIDLYAITCFWFPGTVAFAPAEVSSSYSAVFLAMLP